MQERICQECRGLILREGTWEIVAYPFDKFFNYGEGFVAILDPHSTRYMEKLDGSCIILYYDNVADSWFCATRKSPEADGESRSKIKFSALAKMGFDNIKKPFDIFTKSLNKRYTYTFELTSPYNQVVVLHKETKVTLIGVRDINTLQELDPIVVADELGIPHVTIFNYDSFMNMVESVLQTESLDIEGIVAVDKSFNRVKIKSIAYVAQHGLISGLDASDRNIMRLILLDQADDALGSLDEFLKERVVIIKDGFRKLINKIWEEYNAIKHIEIQKDFALQAKNKTYPHALFYLRKNNEDMEAFLELHLKSSNSIDRLLTFCEIQ
jgi:hypothetical protein